MQIEKLCDTRSERQGPDIYIVGTGPSLRTFPLDFLKDKLTIGLNQAWKHFYPSYSITVHPELVVEFNAATAPPPTQWIVKKKPPMAHLELDDPHYYVFHTSEDLQTVVNQPPDTLYIGRGIQCTALDLACRMGAKNVFLVGCDGGPLQGDHHGHEQHVRFLGLPPADVYAEYRKFTAKVRKVLREKHRVNVLTLTPFVSVAEPGEDYARLCKELTLPALAPPKDVSTYTRKKADL